MHKAILSLILFGFLASCKPEPDGVTMQELIVAKPWQYKSIIYKYTYPNGNVITRDITSSVMPCIIDNLWILHADGTYVIMEENIKCGTNDTFQYGTWELQSNNTALLIDASGAPPKTETIMFLHNSEMQLLEREDSTASLVTDVVVTYKR